LLVNKTNKNIGGKMKKISGTLMLLLAIVVLGVMVLPETYALFSGQHDFYDTTPIGNQVPCQKCHSDIYDELSQPGKVNLMHKTMGCDQCHVTAAPNSEGMYQGPGGQFHAAALVSCIDCHNRTLLYGTFDHLSIAGSGLGCLDCHKNPQSFPGNFSAVEIYSPDESHKNFAEGAGNSKLLKGENEACISCHTHVKVNITWTRPVFMTMNAAVNTNGSWSITNISAEGNATYKTSG
jgi:hypothetical protein